MIQIGAPLAGSYDYGEVARSILIAIAASYAALDLGGRVTASRGRVRAAWLTGGAIAMGIGIWAMHFKAMLAFRLPVTVDYHWPTVLVSLGIAVLASAIALYIATRQKMGPVQAWTGSLIMGGGIAAMHYVGMAAMRLTAVSRFNPLLVALSALLAILFSRIALMFTFDYREDFRGTSSAKILSAAVMGGAISLMHYTGMAAASFVPTAVVPNLSHTVSFSLLGSYGVFIVTLLVLGTAILTSSMDRQAQMESRRLNDRLEQRVVERTRELTATNEELRREIAERQRAEDALQRSEDHLRLVLDTTPALILTGRPDGYLDYFNQGWLNYVGLPLERLQGWGWTSVIHPDDVEGIVGKWRVALTSGEPLDAEARVRRTDGEYRWLLHRKVPLRDEHGNIVKWHGSSIDIDDRKREEEERRRGETYLAMAQRMARMGVWSWKPSSGDMFGSEEFYRIFGLEPDKAKLTREVFLQRIHPEDRPRYETEINAAVVERRNWELDYRIVLPDASVKYVHAIAKPIFDKSGDILEFVGTTLDITGRKRAEQELSQAEEHIRAILEYSPNWIFLKDTEGRYLLVNREIERVFGMSQEQIKGKTDSEIFPPEQAAEYRANDLKVLRAGLAMEFEEIALLEDGPHTSIIHKFPLFDTHGNVYATGGVATDITERVRAEEKLRRLSGKLLRLQDEERRRIARDLHDSTGQNLVALTTMLGQLRGSIPSAERKSRRLLSECKSLADQSIREIRTLSYVLHPPVLDDADLGDAIRDYVKGFTDRSGIQVELELSLRVGRMAREIELALFRVVQESLTNIQRHSGSQEAKIRINCNSHLTLEISDLGHGASAREQRGKEEPRFEVGVGIPGMEERVKLIGGRLDIDSTSLGTTVRVTIPLERNEREKAAHSGG
jgi:PAS domain S-box-containing protein